MKKAVLSLIAMAMLVGGFVSVKKVAYDDGPDPLGVVKVAFDELPDPTIIKHTTV